MESLYTLYIFSDVDNSYNLLDVEAIQMTNIFSVESITDLTKRKDSITKDFTLKGTHANNRALAHLYNISSYSSESYVTDLNHNLKKNRTVRCILLENNIEIVNGSLLIMDADINVLTRDITYNCQIVGHMVSFFGQMNNRELSELDSLNDNIPYTIARIRDTWNFPNNYRYAFGQCDYGYDERLSIWQTDENGEDYEIIPNWWDSAYDFRNFKLGITLKGYLDAIFRGWRYDSTTKKYTQLQANGTPISTYTYEIETLGNDDINRIYIPHTGEQMSYEFTGTLTSLPAINYTLPAQVLGVPPRPLVNSPNLIVPLNTTSFNTSYFSTYQLPSGLTVYKYNDGSDKFNLYTTTPTTVFRTKDRYLKSKVSMTGTITLPADWKGTYYFGLADVTNNPKDFSNLRFAQKIIKTTTTAQTFNIVYNSEVQDIAGNYILAIRREDQGKDNIGVNTDFKVNNLIIKFGDTNVISNIAYSQGQNIPLNKALPTGIKVKDFMKSIMTLFNLYMVTDPENKNKFILKPFTTFYKDILKLDRTKAKDWTDKIDFSTYKLSTNHNLPKAYNFKFTEDTDMMLERYKSETNKNYGDITVNDSKGMQDEKDIEVIFAPTVNIDHDLNRKKLPVLYKAEGFLTGKKKPMTVKPRILYNNGEAITDQYSITHQGNELTKLSTYNHSSMFRYDPLNNNITDTLLFDLPLRYYTNTQDVTDDYSITKYERYHKEQLRTLVDDNIMIIEFQAYLTETDIATINQTFQHPVFIQTPFGNSYFKLLEVEYTNNRYPSTVKAMKIVTPLP